MSDEFVIERIKGRNWKTPKYQAIRLDDWRVLATASSEIGAITKARRKLLTLRKQEQSHE